MKYLLREKRRFDAIVLDAYSSQEIPKQFLTAAFFDLAKSRLHARSALFLMNVIVANDDDLKAERLTRTMHKVWRQIRLLDSKGWENRNAVIAAGSVRTLKKPRLLMPPNNGARKIAAGLKSLNFHTVQSE